VIIGALAVIPAMVFDAYWLYCAPGSIGAHLMQ
jgi:hypothetical protein